MFHLTLNMKRQLLLTLIFGLIVVLFFRGLHLHLASRITDRIKFHAIPIAISELYHHHPHDYTGIKSVEVAFQSPIDTEILITKSIAQTVEGHHENYYWVADDKGFTDYVIASFYLFGPYLKSMYYMWFVILIASVGLFLISFSKQKEALSLLCLLLLGMYVGISTFTLCNSEGMNAEITLSSLSSTALYDTRLLDVLALVSVFHMLILASKTNVFNWRRDGWSLLGQIGVFIFLYHARSSLGWELAAVFIYCLFCLCSNISKKKKSKKIMHKLISPILVVGTLSGSLLFLNVYKHIVYHPQYFAGIGQRTFWHNMLMGLGADSSLQNKYNLKLNDFSAAAAVINFARESDQCTKDVVEQEPQKLLNTLGNWGTADWVSYENCAKKLFFHIVAKNKLSIIRLYVITKPINSLRILKMAMEKSSNIALENVRSQYGMKWSPFNMSNLGFLFITLLLTFRSFHRWRKKHMQMCSIVLIASFIPSVVFYPDVLTEGGLITILPVLLYLALFWMLIKIENKLKKGYGSIHIVDPGTNDLWKETRKLTIVIPAFNEEKRIKITIQEVFTAAQKILDDYEIIVVDDGSDDSTYFEAVSIAAQCGSKVRVIKQNQNQGVGAAFFYGLSQAKFPQLCLIPGDNAYDKNSIELLFEQCGLAPLVISYRNNMEERTPIRHVLSRLATFSLRVLTGARVSDAHSLFLFPVEETRLLKVSASGYGYHMEILSRLLVKLKSYIEVPVLLNPKPDASSGVMKPKTLYILGQTLCRLMCLRILRKL